MYGHFFLYRTPSNKAGQALLISGTMVDMEIQVDIPLPPGPPRARYPFSQMGVGHSFVETDPELIRNLRAAVYMHSRRNPGVRFTVRWREEDKGWRVWRVT